MNQEIILKRTQVKAEKASGCFRLSALASSRSFSLRAKETFLKKGLCDTNSVLQSVQIVNLSSKAERTINASK